MARMDRRGRRLATGTILGDGHADCASLESIELTLAALHHLHRKTERDIRYMAELRDRRAAQIAAGEWPPKREAS